MTKIAGLLGCMAFGVLFMVYLHYLSDKLIHYHNSFVRRYPQHVAQQSAQADLKYNSYYFAGTAQGRVYLGNYTAPLQVMELDSTLQSIKIHRITLNQSSLPFKSPQLKVEGHSFLLYEGSVPYIFKGSSDDWKGALVHNSGQQFSHLVPMDNKQAAVRFIDEKSGGNIIGSIELGSNASQKINTALLEGQFDNTFSTDGALLFSSSLQELVYVYTYRNQFIVARKDLELKFRGNTIDTVSKAKIKLATIPGTGLKTFAEPPLVVNKTSAVEGNYLFINSQLPGQYDAEELWRSAAIIDIYDLTDKSYRSSFPIYHIGKEHLRSLAVIDNKVYALIGNFIVCYRIEGYFRQSKPAASTALLKRN